MRLAYLNGYYRPSETSGGNAHIWQFVRNAVALGHEVWTWPDDQHPDARHLPQGRLARWCRLRGMDALYVRVEWQLAEAHARLGTAAWRTMLGSPVVVWEFNTVPEFGLLLGKGETAVAGSVESLRRYGVGCDLAVCVSSHLEAYVSEHLGIARTLMVPNGSDPEHFRPDLEPVPRISESPGCLNVAWVGSADLPWHAFQLLSEAACLLWQRPEGRRILFHVIGQGLRSVRDLPPNVHYHGPEDYRHLPRWLAGMQVGLCLYQSGPSDYGSPLKFFDYLSSGLAVVSTPQPQVVSLLSELGLGEFVVPANDSRALAAVLATLATDPERVAMAGRRGREMILAKYTWKHAVEKTLDEIGRLLADRHAGLRKKSLSDVNE